MAKKELSHHSLYLAIVAIVAVVAVVVLVLSLGRTTLSEQAVEVVDEEGNIVGEAFRIGPSKYSLPSGSRIQRASLPTRVCSDTDGDVNFFVQGTATSGLSATFGLVSRTDICQNGITLNEYSCNQDGSIRLSVFNCPSNGNCSIGACFSFGG